MDLRHHPAAQTPDRPRPRRDPTSQPEERTTTLDPRTPWESLVVWFLASFELGPDIALGYGRPDKNRNPTATSITLGDGSWAEVTLADDHGIHHVREAGPRQVWRAVEDAHHLWTTLGQPGWNRFGLTVTHNQQRVWLDAPTSDHTWSLAPLPPHDRQDTPVPT